MMAAASPCDDQAVRDGIKEALADLTSPVSQIRPNKLRKLVCKSTGATWTQFQIALEQMIGSGAIKSKLVEGEKVILIDDSTTNKQRRDENEETSARTTGSTNKSQQKNKKEITMEIPLAVAHHLTRKGRRKQRNIESTTKTELSMSGTEKAKNPRDLVNLVIVKKYDGANTEKEQKADGTEERATKHLNAARVHIENMIKSYKAHPDRYTAKKAGGTFAEQEKAKKLKAAGAKRRAERHQHHSKQIAADADVGGVGKASCAKKKKRKFY